MFTWVESANGRSPNNAVSTPAAAPDWTACPAVYSGNGTGGGGAHWSSEVSTKGRSRSQYGSVTPVGLRPGSVLIREDFGRVTMNERSAAVPTARVSAGLPSVTASETADSDVAMYCDGSPVLTQYCRPRGGFQVSPRVSVNRSVAAQSRMARPRAAP